MCGDIVAGLQTVGGEMKLPTRKVKDDNELCQNCARTLSHLSVGVSF
jgi:hypothetical protein